MPVSAAPDYPLLRIVRLTCKACPHKRLPLGGENNASRPTQGILRIHNRERKCRITRQSPESPLDQRPDPWRVAECLPHCESRKGCACGGIFSREASVVAR
jgi:hypothetical protein